MAESSGAWTDGTRLNKARPTPPAICAGPINLSSLISIGRYYVWDL